MKITLEYRKPTPAHCDVAIFVNGALAGTITLRQEELGIFQDIIASGCLPRSDQFLAQGNPDYHRAADKMIGDDEIIRDYRREKGGK